MVVTRAYIQSLRKQARMTINGELEAIILAKYGSEPTPYTFSAQDLYEQLRKLVYNYNTYYFPDPF